jgi:hypothetical protein
MADRSVLLDKVRLYFDSPGGDVEHASELPITTTQSWSYPEFRIIRPMPSRGLCRIGARRAAYWLLNGVAVLIASA